MGGLSALAEAANACNKGGRPWHPSCQPDNADLTRYQRFGARGASELVQDKTRLFPRANVDRDTLESKGVQCYCVTSIDTLWPTHPTDSLLALPR